jgi:sugar phosphate isomerase/epimerase
MDNKIILCDDCDVIKTSELCKKYNFGIEIQSFYHHDNYTDEIIQKHIEAIKNINLCSMHGPFGDLCPGSFDPMVREVALKRFNLFYEVTKKLNVKRFILHNGYVPNTNSPKNYLKRAIPFWINFINSINKDIEIYIENFLEKEIEMFVDLIDGVNNNNFGVNIDVGHINCNTNQKVIDWIIKLNKRIKYFHLHDNNGKQDEHLALGKGNIPFKEVFEVIKEYCNKAILSIETNLPFLEDSIDWLFKNNIAKSTDNSVDA